MTANTPPELPRTRLTRGWRAALESGVLRERARRRRLVRSIVAFAAIDVVVIIGVLVLLAQGDGTPSPAPTVRLPAFVTGVVRRGLAPTFVRAAHESRVPVALLMGLTWRESEWQPGLVSSAGAVGIGQLLPATSTFVAQALLHDPRLDPTRPVDNIRLTARYLRELIDQLGGGERLGIGAYLQGSTSVRATGLTAPTVMYVDQVEQLRTQFAAAARGR